MRHVWIRRFSLTVCKRCGVVRRREAEDTLCPGKVKMTLRNEGGELGDHL